METMSSRDQLLITIAILLQLTGCSQPTPLLTPTPTATPVVAAMEPFASNNFAVRGVVPRGWFEFKPGWFARRNSPDDQAAVFLLSYMDANPAWPPYVLARQTNLKELPEPVETYQTSALTWNVYTVEANLPGAEKLVVDMAAAESGGVLYLAGLQALKPDYGLLHTSVFLPMLDALEPAPVAWRDQLTAAELMDARHPIEGPVYNDYFTPLGDYAAARHRFEGKLTVPGFQMQLKVTRDEFSRSRQDRFPGFSVEFFTYRDYLVPVSQDILPAQDARSFWRVVISPGKIWSEPGDGGMSRASFPFVLVVENSIETHNGIATFLFDDTHTSALRIQVVQETASWNINDYWGQGAMVYTPGILPNRDVLAEQFAQELSRQVPIHPWTELEEEYDPHLLSTFTGKLDLIDVSATGLIMDGTIYLQPCATRFGPFPYCGTMRHAAFSVTKSMAAAVALLRLAEKYGDEVFDLKVSDYVSLTAAHAGWKEVTFGDALNMATGIGDNPNLDSITAEEDQPKFSRFLEAKSTQDKLDVVSSYGQYPWGPGEVARYNSINTFTLSVAMNNFLKSKAGPQADIWDMVVEEVYKPIGIDHAPIMRTIEPDGSRGVPIFGYGLYPTVEDVAKVALLLQNGGQYQGRQLLHAGRLAEALRQDAAVGLPTREFNEYGEGRYHLSFWSMPYRTARGDSFQVPYMSGFGGNRVVFNPNGIIAFRFTDALDYELEPLIKVADGIRPLGE